MKAFFKYIFLFILYLICTNNVSAQNNEVSKKYYLDEFSLRNSNYFNSGINYNNYGANRFSANPSFSVLDNWSSLNTKIILNDLPINISLLGYSSLDFLPIDILTNEIIAQNFSEVNSIKITSRKISDSLEIKFRSFLGGETGDPLIYIFTRPDIAHVNKNKIVPSAVFSLSNSFDKIQYRISAGYFGYFSTGSINDQIMFNKSKYYFGKQNKQFLAGTELNYQISETKNIEFKFNFISYYGWDIPPFINTFLHFENYFHRAQISFNNLIENFSFKIKKDGQIVYFNNTETEKEIGVLENDFSIFADWRKSYDKNLLFVNTEINNISTENVKTNSNNIFKYYLNKEINKINLNAGIGYKYFINDKINSLLRIGFNKHYIKSSLNYSFNFNYKFNENNEINLFHSSFVNYPNEIELYGNYIREFTNPENQLNMISQIKSNDNLDYERRMNFGITYLSRFTDNVNFEIVPIYEIVKNPIELKSTANFRDYFTNEFVTNGFYLNGENKSAFSVYNSLNFDLSENINFTCEYKFTENSGAGYFPRHKSKLEINYNLPILGFFELNWIYQSKTRWKNFDLSNNDLGIIDNFSTINFYYRLELYKFYFIENLHFIIGLENLLDEEVKFMPNGNVLNRLIKFSLSAEL